MGRSGAVEWPPQTYGSRSGRCDAEASRAVVRQPFGQKPYELRLESIIKSIFGIYYGLSDLSEGNLSTACQLGFTGEGPIIIKHPDSFGAIRKNDIFVAEYRGHSSGLWMFGGLKGFLRRFSGVLVAYRLEASQCLCYANSNRGVS